MSPDSYKSRRSSCHSPDRIFVEMTRASKVDSNYPLDWNHLNELKFEKLLEYFNAIEDKEEFSLKLIQKASLDNSVDSIKVLISIFKLPANFQLREEVMSFFGFPLFANLSDIKVKHEVELCQDSRLLEAVKNISNSISEDLNLRLQSEFFFKFINQVLNSSHIEFIQEALKFITLLLAQPSCRRFVKPLLEDVLFGSIIKYKGVDQFILQDFEEVFYFPIDEVSGVYFEAFEEYAASHFSKVRDLQSKLLNFPELEGFAKSSQKCFLSYEGITQAIAYLSVNNLHSIIFHLGIDGYSRELPNNVLIDYIAGNLVLRPNFSSNHASIFPTEKNLFSQTIIRPLTVESLSHQELLQRHQKMLQSTLFHELSEHVKENVDACKPVLNRNGKTEFSGWTRDAMEIVSSAIIKTSCPDIQKQGKFQKIELEVSVHLSALDQLSLKSWMDLKPSEVIFVCQIDAQETVGYQIKTLLSVVFDSKLISKNILTMKLFVDPDQYEMNSRTGIYSKLNFVIKRSSSESNDVRILKSITSQFNRSFPDFIEDALLGIASPNDVLSPPEELKSSNTFVSACLNSGLSIVDGSFGSGVTTILKETTKVLLNQNKSTVVLFRSGPAADKFYQDLIEDGASDYEIVRLGFSSSNLGNLHQRYSNLIQKYVEIINTEILSGFENGNMIYTCTEADYIMRRIIAPRWEAFKVLLEADNTQNLDLLSVYPFANCANLVDQNFREHFNWICSVFNVAKRLAPLELLQSGANISRYVLGNLAKVVLMTSKYAAINAKSLSESGLNFESLFIDDCNLIPEIEVLLTFSSQAKNSILKRLGLFGHSSAGRPQFYPDSGASISLIDRFICSGFNKTITLPFNPPSNFEKSKSSLFASSTQFINVPAILGKGEEMPIRNYIQNLDEAEYSVALFQYLRLMNVPSKDIAIITAYKGQVDLIKEVLQTRCNWTEFYGDPAFIGTLDQSIGLHFKNVIVSLVRTKSLGFLTDPSRLDLAFTRASDNLIVLASADLFSKQFNVVNELGLVDGTLFGNVEDFTKYVYELSIKNISK